MTDKREIDSYNSLCRFIIGSMSHFFILVIKLTYYDSAVKRRMKVQSS